jgi:D-alanyl-D-alanine carboxypeptidase (penicillin-binding protein 5/6)
MDKSMKQRTLLMIVLVLMVVLVVVMGTFFSSVLSFWQGADGSVATPTATPTEIPTPTDTPIPTPTPSPSPTPTPLVNGSSAYLLDTTSGRVLLNVQGRLRVPLWSTTKIMTALLAIERLQPDQVVTIEQAELDEVPPGLSTAQLHATDQMSILHLLYGLLLPSGSDADLVKLARVAMGYPLFAQIVSTPSYHLDPNLSHYRYDWTNILAPFLQRYPGANGIKTGSNAAETDWCMVFSAGLSHWPALDRRRDAGSYGAPGLS